MEDTIKIQKLNQLLKLFLKDNLKIAHYKTKKLTAPGENYGSLMLQVEIELEDNNSSSNKKCLQLVAKMCPPNEWLKKMFTTVITFKKEIAVYQTILPILKSLQIERGAFEIVDCIPKCYGARISLSPELDVVDDDAVLLLENLKLQGYQTMDRMEGFDLETTKLLIKNLAVFHAVPIGVKLLNSDVFKSKILPNLQRLCMYDNLSNEGEQQMIDNIIDTAAANKECIPLLPKVRKHLLDSLNNLRNPSEPREPFATINHNDLWVNNAMIKLEGNVPIKCKIVDFQLIEYGSPGNDIIFLLFSSVKKEILDLHYDSLIKLYYKVFIKTLRDLKCDVTPFTYELFIEEINTSARRYQFLHTMVMLKPIFLARGAVKEIHELSEEELMKEDTVSDEYKQKVPEMILQFEERGWI